MSSFPDVPGPAGPFPRSFIRLKHLKNDKLVLIMTTAIMVVVIISNGCSHWIYCHVFLSFIYRNLHMQTYDPHLLIVVLYVSFTWG